MIDHFFRKVVLTFETILIELKFHKINIICGVMHNPPNHNFDANNTFMYILSALLLKLKNQKKIVFLMGDFNRNMLNPNNQTNAFVDVIFSPLAFSPLINKPTHISTAATLIDNILTNNLKYVTKSAIVVGPDSRSFWRYIKHYLYKLLCSKNSSHSDKMLQL